MAPAVCWARARFGDPLVPFRASHAGPVPWARVGVGSPPAQRTVAPQRQQPIRRPRSAVPEEDSYLPESWLEDSFILPIPEHLWRGDEH